MAPNPTSGASGSSTTNGAVSTTNESVRTSVSSNGKIPPPRPPPPVFIRTSTDQASADWNNSHISRSATPPSLPSNSPPPLSESILDFSIMDDDAKSESALTDVVEIHDKVNTYYYSIFFFFNVTI